MGQSMYFFRKMTVFVTINKRMLALAFQTRRLFKSEKILRVIKCSFGVDLTIIIPCCLIRKCYRRDY